MLTKIKLAECVHEEGKEEPGRGRTILSQSRQALSALACAGSGGFWGLGGGPGRGPQNPTHAGGGLCVCLT
jgi:hypothetical protein